MSHLPLSPAGQCVVYLAVALLFLGLAVRMGRRALEPIGAVLHAMAAAAVAAFAAGVGVVLLAAAALTGLLS